MVLQWSCGPVEATAVVAGSSHRWQHYFRIGLEFSVGGMAAPFNLVTRAQFPTPLYICAVRQGPTNQLGLGSPDQGAEARAQ